MHKSSARRWRERRRRRGIDEAAQSTDTLNSHTIAFRCKSSQFGSHIRIFHIFCHTHNAVSAHLKCLAGCIFTASNIYESFRSDLFFFNLCTLYTHDKNDNCLYFFLSAAVTLHPLLLLCVCGIFCRWAFVASILPYEHKSSSQSRKIAAGWCFFISSAIRVRHVLLFSVRAAFDAIFSHVHQAPPCAMQNHQTKIQFEPNKCSPQTHSHARWTHTLHGPNPPAFPFS